MRKRVLGLATVVMAAIFAAPVLACEPGSGLARSFGKGVGVGGLAGYPGGGARGFTSTIVPNVAGFAAMHQQQMAMQRQALAASSARRRARLRPMRIEKAKAMRQEVLAKRQANREWLAKKLNAKKQQQANQQIADVNSPQLNVPQFAYTSTTSRR